MRGRDRAGRSRDLLERVGLPRATPTAEAATPSPAASASASRSPARSRSSRALLICDEPVAALDVSVQAQILEAVRDRCSASSAIELLFITHDLAVVRQMTTRLLVCHRGVIVERGSTERVLDHPEHPYTRELRDAVDASTNPDERRA